jgi:hypothetical protein
MYQKRFKCYQNVTKLMELLSIIKFSFTVYLVTQNVN